MLPDRGKIIGKILRVFSISSFLYPEILLAFQETDPDALSDS